jgi:hypothetical protein
VRLSGRVVGSVIARNEEEALRASVVKYPGWGIEEDRSVEIKKNRRRRKK